MRERRVLIRIAQEVDRSGGLRSRRSAHGTRRKSMKAGKGIR